MRREFIGPLLFALLVPGCLHAQLVSTDCELAALPGQGKEYNLFKNLLGARHGCEDPSPVTYQKTETYQKIESNAAPAPAQKGHAAPPQQNSLQDSQQAAQQQELDRTACKSEGERAAKAAHGLQPGEYDIFKSMAAAQSNDAQKFEQSCMAARGYKAVAN